MKIRIFSLLLLTILSLQLTSNICYAQLVEEWVARWNGTINDDDGATSITVDADGNVYATGWTTISYLMRDYITVKYNSAGQEQWVAMYNGPGNNQDRANAITVDSNENVYVTGYSYGVDSHKDYATIKYDATGVQQWVARYDGPSNGGDTAYDIALDEDGNVYVTGYSDGGWSDADYATVKYNSQGEEQWVARYNGVMGIGDDCAYALTLDENRNVYVTGDSQTWMDAVVYDSFEVRLGQKRRQWCYTGQ